MKKAHYLLVLFLAFVFVACMHKPMFQEQVVPDDCMGITPTFNKEVAPIFKNSCAKSGCHDGDAMPLDFSKYENIAPLLNDSGIYYAVVINRTMPQDVALDTAKLQVLKCWFRNGFPEN